METIMQHGGYRNESCAKIYIEDSLHYKTRTGNMITSTVFGQTPSIENGDDSSSIINEISAGEPSSSTVNGANLSSTMDQISGEPSSMLE